MPSHKALGLIQSRETVRNIIYHHDGCPPLRCLRFPNSPILPKPIILSAGPRNLIRSVANSPRQPISFRHNKIISIISRMCSGSVDRLPKPMIWCRGFSNSIGPFQSIWSTRKLLSMQSKNTKIWKVHKCIWFDWSIPKYVNIVWSM